MAMQKFSDGEGRLEVLRGREANVLHDFQSRLGIYKVSDFSDADKEQLMATLEEARKLDADEAEESRQPRKAKRAVAEDARESSSEQG